jgi:alpha-tubulin suppressor-like RCC1 family protein
MRVPFRQGILTHSVTGAQQTFLGFNTNSNFVDLKVSDGPLELLFAHKTHDYLVGINSTVTKAWGPLDRTVDNYPYVDIDAITGTVSYGNSLLPLIVGSEKPELPAPGQHWFNTVERQMYEYVGSAFMPKIRVFVAKLKGSSSTFSSLSGGYVQYTHAGTQIGSGNEIFAGRILFNDNGRPIRRNDGTFFTTEDQFFVSGSDINAVRLDSVVDLAKASTNVPLYTVVAYDTTIAGQIKPANYDDVGQTTIGIALQTIVTSGNGGVLLNGIVQHSGFNFSADIGKLLYVQDGGTLSINNPHTVDPVTYPTARSPVARVLRKDTIVFDQGIAGNTATATVTNEAPELNITAADLPVATSTEFGAVKINIDPAVGQDPIVASASDPRFVDDRAPLPHTHDAINVCFDPSGRDCFNQDNVQQALYELCDQIENIDFFASTGFNPFWKDVDHFSDPDNSESFPWTVVTNDSLKVDTTGGDIWLLLPADPIDGAYVNIAPVENTYSANTLHILNNGRAIEGLNEKITVSIDGVMLKLIYNVTTSTGTADNSWHVYYVGDHSLGAYAGGVSSALGNRLDLIEQSLLRTVPYDLSFFASGPHTPDASVGLYVLPREVTFTTDVTPVLTQAYAEDVSSGTVEYTLSYRSTDGGTTGNIGTVTFSAGSNNGVFAFVGTPPIAVPADYIIELTTDATADATLGDIAITIVGCAPIANCDGSGADPNGFPLQTLTDVTITNAQDLDILIYDAVSSEWKNGPNVSALGAKILNDLTDVTITSGTLANTNFLVYNGTRWVNQNAVISRLFDVTITSPVNDEVLTYNNGVWKNIALSLVTSVSDLSDTTITSPQNGQALVYQSGSWINQDPGADHLEWDDHVYTLIDHANGTSGTPYQTQAQRKYYVKSTSGNVFLKLPAPSAGRTVTVVDYGKNLSVNPLYVKPNAAENVGGSASDFVVDINGIDLTFVSDGTNWNIVTEGDSVDKNLAQHRYVAINNTATTGSPYTFSGNAKVQVDSAAGAVFIELPANPYNGQYITVKPVATTYAANNLTFKRNTRRINGLQANYIVSEDGVVVTLVFNTTNDSWQVYNQGKLFGLASGDEYIDIPSAGNNTSGTAYALTSAGKYKTDTAAGPVYVDLPTGAPDGTYVDIVPVANNYSLNGLFVTAADAKVGGNSGTYRENINGQSLKLVYDLTLDDWKVYKEARQGVGVSDPSQFVIRTGKTGTAGQGQSGFHVGIYIMADGSFNLHGYNSYGANLQASYQVYEPLRYWLPNGVKAVQGYAYQYSRYILGDDGNVYSWGYNGSGELGVGDKTERRVITKIEYFETQGISIADVIVGDHTNTTGKTSTFFLTTDGDVYVAGRNVSGIHGTGNATVTYDAVTPIKITSLSYIVGIWKSGGATPHAFAKKNDGTVYAWGCNGNGQLGLGDTADRDTPTVVTDLQGAQQVLPICGRNDRIGWSLALMSNGRIKGAGRNTYGTLGDGTVTERNSFVSLTGTAATLTFVQIAGADGNAGIAAGVTNNGDLWTWGRNAQGQQVSGNTTNQTTPRKVPGDFQGKVKFVRAFGGTDNSLYVVVTTDNKVYTAGYGGHGCLGNGYTGYNTNSAAIGYVYINPTTLPTDEILNVTSFGYNHWTAPKILYATGEVWGAGLNQHGSTGITAANANWYTTNYTQIKMR